MKTVPNTIYKQYQTAFENSTKHHMGAVPKPYRIVASNNRCKQISQHMETQSFGVDFIRKLTAAVLISHGNSQLRCSFHMKTHSFGVDFTWKFIASVLISHGN